MSGTYMKHRSLSVYGTLTLHTDVTCNVNTSIALTHIKCHN